MNEAIQRFVDELAADPTVRGIILFGSHARGTREPTATRTC
jgi:predicted nucleotidyltransferase